MKPLLLLSAILLSCLTLLNAQSDSSALSSAPVKRHLVSSAFVHLYGGEITKGWLYRVNDSQLAVVNVRKGKLKRLNDPNFNFDGKTSIMAVEQIKSISVQRKNAGLRGALFGIGIGALTGAIAGYAEGDDPIMQYNGSDIFQGIAVGLNNAFAMTAGEKAFTYGAAFGVLGGVIGGITGALAKKKFIIGGRKEKFHDLQGELMRRLVIQ